MFDTRVVIKNEMLENDRNSYSSVDIRIVVEQCTGSIFSGPQCSWIPAAGALLKAGESKTVNVRRVSLFGNRYRMLGTYIKTSGGYDRSNKTVGTKKFNAPAAFGINATSFYRLW